MPITDWEDPEEERQAIRREKARLERIRSYRTTSTRQQAQAVADIVTAYPHMSIGTAVPLGLSGATPNDPFTQHIAVKEAKVGKRKRGFWGAVGDIAGDVVSAPFDVASEVGKIGTGALKPVVRYGVATLAAPWEELAGGLRTVAAVGGATIGGIATGATVGGGLGLFAAGFGAIPGAIIGGAVGGVVGGVAQMRGVDIEGGGWRPQSTLATSLTGGGSMGAGYLPGGAAWEESAERARRTARIGKHAFTPGRFLAATAFDEDTAPYTLLSGLVDATAAWKLDPSAAAGRQYKLVRQGSGRWGRAFAPTTRELARLPDEERLAAGLVDGGHRPGIIRENTANWIRGRQGTKTMEILAQADDYESIRRTLGKDVDFETILDVLDAKTKEAAEAVLGPKLGLDPGLELKPRASTPAIKVRRARDQFRFTQDLPRGGLNPSRPEEMIEQFTRFQHNAKLPYQTITRNNEALARALRAGDVDMVNAVIMKDFVGGADGILTRNHKIAPLLAKQMGDIWHSVPATIRRELIDEIADGTRVPATRINGQTVQLTAPSTMVEALENIVDFDADTVRAIRRATSKLSTVVSHPVWSRSVDVAAFITNKIWKLPTLARGAYTVRNTGEANLRMAAHGNDSAFSHPLDYLAWVAADDGRIGHILRKVGVKPRGGVDPVGAAFHENPIEAERALRGEMNDYAETLNRQAHREGWLEDTLIKGRTKAEYRHGEPHYVDMLTEKLEALHRDPVIQALADPVRSAVRDAPSWPWNPMSLLNDSRLGPAIQDYVTLSGAGQLSTKGGRIPDPDAVAGWFNRTMKQAQDAAGGDSRLWDVLASGKVDDIPLRLPDGRVNPEFKRRLGELVDQGVGPPLVAGAAVTTGPLTTWYNNATSRVFDIIGTVPETILAKSPTFRQELWSETARLITEATPEAQRALREVAGEANLSKRALEDLATRAKVASGDLTAAELTILASGRARRTTQKLLYGAVDKNQLSDILRVVFPFMEPLRNSMMTWARLGTENPAVLRRVPQVMNAARGQGTFYKDPQTGEEMFVYPGSRILTDKLLGAPIPLTGRVEGLNVIGSGLLPGAGPVMQLPVRWFVPDKPKWDQVRNMIDPFGESTRGGTLEQFAPAWIRNVLTGKAADPEDAAFGDDIFQIVAADVSSGHSDVSTPEGLAEALESAKTKARWLTVFKGFAQLGGSPTAMDPRFVAEDKEGRWHLIGAIKEEFRDMVDKAGGDYSAATETFLTKFGTDMGIVLQSTTDTGGRILPDATRSANNWLRTHPNVEKDYPATFGLFAPGDDEDFDMQAWARQRNEEQRLALTPEQRVKLSNQRMANLVLYNVKDRFGPYPSAAQEQVLRTLRNALRTEYPGFQEHLALPEKVTTEEKIAELEAAVDDPKLASRPVVSSIRIYLAARARLNQMAQQAGRANINAAKDMAPLRAILRQLGQSLVRERPDFADSWERVFRREIDIDEEAVVPLASA